MKRLAVDDEATPLTASAVVYSTAWDADMIFACKCDSSWPVGLDAGETQEPEYFGADCSLRHCASGDDPMTTSSIEAITTATATWSGTELTVTSISVGSLSIGQKITGTGIDVGTYIVAIITGAGGAGTYTLSLAQTISGSGSISGLFNYIETDCSGRQAPGSTAVGASGNLCHVDCANRGVCDYRTGTCACFTGFSGSSCTKGITEFAYKKAKADV